MWCSCSLSACSLVIVSPALTGVPFEYLVFPCPIVHLPSLLYAVDWNPSRSLISSDAMVCALVVGWSCLVCATTFPDPMFSWGATISVFIGFGFNLKYAWCPPITAPASASPPPTALITSPIFFFQDAVLEDS